MEWNYTHEEQKFEVLPEGKYRVRIKSADKATSVKGNDMLVIQLEVSGSKKTIYYYIPFLADRPEITNRMLTAFFASFKGIPEGNLNTQSWIGQVGACELKHEDYNGDPREKVKKFIPADKQDDLPNWVEPSSGMETLGAEEDLPF